jgi:hypothetical protein
MPRAWLLIVHGAFGAILLCTAAHLSPDMIRGIDYGGSTSTAPSEAEPDDQPPLWLATA